MPSPQVNSCHLDIAGTPVQDTCQNSTCKSKSCHQSVPAQRDLGGPSFRTEQEASHPLVHDPRTPLPECRAEQSQSARFCENHLPKRFLQLPHHSNQILSHLKTVVLRH